MPKRLAYIGLKTDGERAFKELTGIEWMPGSEHDVKDEVADVMLKHTDVWKQVPAKDASLAAAPAATKTEAVLPEWAVKGVELGATDDQLEAIAQAGGPETEVGAAVWRDAVGSDWAEKKPAAKKAVAKKGK